MSRLLSIATAVGFLLLASCAPGTDGILITSAEAPAESGPVWTDNTITIELPRIPVVSLPDLSTFGDYDDLLQERLENLPLQPIDGDPGDFPGMTRRVVHALAFREWKPLHRRDPRPFDIDDPPKVLRGPI